METLFPHTVTAADVPSIPGLRYLPEYVTQAEELALAEAIDGLPWNTEWRRRRQPYGAGCGTADPVPPIPDWGRRLADDVKDVPFDQMLVNEYLPGQGIAPHRHYAPFGRTVMSLSLLSRCVMDFRHPPTGRRERPLLERRSLLVMGDGARYDWMRGIAPRKRDAWHGRPVDRGRRLSVTFRFRAVDRARVPAPPPAGAPRRSPRTGA